MRQRAELARENHDDDGSSPDGGNWEPLSLYCPDNEHMRYPLAGTHDEAGATDNTTLRPFAAPGDPLGGKKPAD